MSIFTDKDLKGLKENISRFKETGAYPWSISGDNLDALIARLEAAEDVCGEVDFLDIRLEKDFGGLLLILDKWRKAAGES